MMNGRRYGDRQTRRREADERAAKIVELVKRGVAQKAIAERLGVTTRTIQVAVADAKLRGELPA
ncbi:MULTISPECIES: helix-turn-helix domain-containing protein [Rhodoplanes]|nr:helix-turn-helix domain-containing protein [Rhodoplanes serenus]